MITIQLQGGLGNQMFQYAFGRSLEARGNQVCFDRSPVDADPHRCYSLDAFKTVVRFSKPHGQMIVEKNMRFTEKYFAVKDVTLNGYWQCEKYFLCVEDVIRKDFELRNEPSAESKKLADKILRAENPTFLHVRRGDNLTARALAYHGYLGWEYYQLAIDYISGRVSNPRFFLFSDDPEWCKQNLFAPNMSVVECNKPGDGKKPGREHEDIWLMSLCKHGITANSSFSWWGAWLGSGSDRIIVSPKRWFVTNLVDATDIVPDRWRRM